MTDDETPQKPEKPKVPMEDWIAAPPSDMAEWMGRRIVYRARPNPSQDAATSSPVPAPSERTGPGEVAQDGSIVPAGDREYLVRITRHPLTREQIEDMRSRSELPADHRSRSVRITDFVSVRASDDSEASLRALGETVLTIKGERVELHEVFLTDAGSRFRALS